jgi:hypothetical protein
MTKHEKAVLRACAKRMDEYLREHNHADEDDVLLAFRGERGPRATLIRAVANWRKSQRRAHQPSLTHTEDRS